MSDPGFQNDVGEGIGVDQSTVNQVCAKERVTIERCFGQLKMRFPILHYKVRTKLESVGKIIMCCCILHNVAKYLQDDNNFPELEDDSQPEPEVNGVPEGSNVRLAQV